MEARSKQLREEVSKASEPLQKAPLEIPNRVDAEKAFNKWVMETLKGMKNLDHKS